MKITQRFAASATTVVMAGTLLSACTSDGPIPVEHRAPSMAGVKQPLAARALSLNSTPAPTRSATSFWNWQPRGAPTPTSLLAPERSERPTSVLTRRVFAKNSFWYKPIPADAALHANSTAFVAEFLRQKSQYYGNVTINTTSYASPVYIAGRHAPVVRVTEWDCQKKGFKTPALAAQWAAVPIPAHAVPANGTDREMAIYQPSTNSYWEFWQARKTPDGRWEACWGGGMRRANKSPGIWPQPFGTTATGLPFIGGQITADELKRGVINHVIGISLVDVERWSVSSWPALRSDGYNPDNKPNRIPEGTRFRLDPKVHVESLNLSPVGKTVARAAQKYGFVVWDKAGAISLRAENPKSYPGEDPYPSLFKGPSYAVLNGFPWEKLQFLPKDYGKP